MVDSVAWFGVGLAVIASAGGISAICLLILKGF